MKSRRRNKPPKEDLARLLWIDEFIGRIRSFIYVRLEDNLLIKRPNSAVKLNPSGAKLLQELIKGRPIASIIKKNGADKRIIIDIHNFMIAVKEHLAGDLNESSLNPALEIEPFKIDFCQLPVLSELALTYRCNLKCHFCYAGCNCTVNPIQDEREMSDIEIKKVIKKIFTQARVPSISFTGGEPTLHAGLAKFIGYAKSLGMRVNLISNGSLIDKKMARNLKKSGLDSAQISLEGVTEQTHDHIVSRQGAFRKTIAAVKYLKEADIHTHTNTTITTENQQECHLMPKFIKESLGNDKFSMNLIIPSGSGTLNKGILIRYSDIPPILSEIITASDESGVEFMWYSPVPMCIFNSIEHGLGNKGCSACDGLLSVAANGDILPCSSFSKSVGNLLHQDFSEIWESVRARELRNKQLAHPGCRNCGYFRICHGACPLYWDYFDFHEILPYQPLAGKATALGEPIKNKRAEKIMG